ncbi:ACP S-malonyltransferase [Blattabacterium punctulatus]|uniref:ACP S-malonyltransferase n=1 Tax=Blattabacterium punctulatus TaxID=164514 RepID=UPI000D7C407F|nr:ACP S-malonyltransferase [Blattabacterium punctulatus]AWU42821.1 [acyl-carrier-protein] S-malonyltransferase [Blattabacterium punctulatus]AWU43368.1 [acyl-carrier-protein] S-malonyltransferase [Blattabacterium punctulatus]AWU45022.1 [acyl-carrier-protein] S-malonyltransferase [Blattabacterium punctulatus]AWU46105.1 [acyl-carrier-protein] S-malonyltransferase [Blattabacterium punctulatus]
MKAYIFPGQGSQYMGMGKDLYNFSNLAKKLFQLSDDILGFHMKNIMFNGSMEVLKKTKYTQLAIYIYSVIKAKILDNFNPDMVAGHSLGELSALTAINVFSFEDGLILVDKRASIMQEICEYIHGGMAVIFGLEDEIIEKVCKEDNGIVVPSNYNSPGQLVISGEEKSLKRVCQSLKKIGAKRILRLPVHGAFHSPIMEPAKQKLSKFIEKISFKDSQCPIYQNVTAKSVTKSNDIKKNLIEQLTSPVKWKQLIENMIDNGAVSFIEVGPGNILQGITKNIFNKIYKK